MEEKVERLRIKLLYEQGLMTQAAGLINISIFALVIRNAAARPMLLSWVTCGVLLFISRSVIQAYFRIRFRDKPFNPAVWENLFCVSVLLSGAYWAFAGTVLLASPLVAHQTFLAFVLAGITAGATVGYSSSLKAVTSFIVPALIPFTIVLTLGGEIQKAMAAMIFLYTITIFVVIVRVNNYVLNSIRLGFEKDLLMTQLQVSQADSLRAHKMAALGMLAGGVAHEINTPLAAIRLKMEELAYADSDKKGISSEVDQIVTRIAKIVSALKSFARSNPQNASVPISIGTVITDTLALCRGQFEGHGISITVQEGPEDCIFMGRAEQIGQALLNLMTNSFEALQGVRNGWITINVQADDQKIYLAVIDNGRGIAVDARHKLMQPFFTTKEVGAGPGLGLSTALGIVKEHGGDLQLDAISQSTKFVMILPKLRVGSSTAA